MSETSATDTAARGRAFISGLNPYGLTYHLGLQGAGGPRANPNGAGLEGFIAIAIEARRPRDRNLRSLAARARATTNSRRCAIGSPGSG